MSMSSSRSDRLLGLAWAVFGITELSYGAYQVLRTWRRLTTPDLAAIFPATLPYVVVLLLLVFGGVGIAFGRKWAWITTLAVSLLFSAFSCFASTVLFLNAWLRHFDAVPATTTLVSTVVIVSLTAWTVGRFFSRTKPWQGVQPGR